MVRKQQIRRHISWKRKCAAATAELGYLRMTFVIRSQWDRPPVYMSGIPYNDAKKMTEDEFLSQWQWDHNKYHSWDKDRAEVDHFSNLTPMLTKEHREKTKRDLKILAKSRRIRARQAAFEEKLIANKFILQASDALSGGFSEGCRSAYERITKEEGKRRKIRSRGFDKTRSRKMSGKVVPR